MPRPRNIILLLTDQWRWDTIFQRPHPCQTPNLDRFAASATVFHNAYTCCPLCTPARGSLFTGKWPYQNHLTDNVGGTSYYPKGQLHRSHVTFLERLRKAGYQVSYAGKWHLGKGTLHQRGIDRVLSSDGGDEAHQSTAGRFPRPETFQDMRHPFYGSFTHGVNIDQEECRSGMEQLRMLSKEAGPFCSVISCHGPHFPCVIPKKFADMYRDLPRDFTPANHCAPFQEAGKPLMQSRPYWPCQETREFTSRDWRRISQHYWAYCTYLDHLLGEIFKEVDALGLMEHTVIGFTSDHGEMLGAHGRFDKGPFFYEEIVHIPMIVFDPLRRAPVNRAGFVNLRDLFPTLIHLAGAASVLTDQEAARCFWLTSHDHTFYTYDAYQGREFKLRGLRTAQYKYHWSPHDRCELYDLQSDPGERNNLIDSPGHAAVAVDLHGKLLRWMASEEDVLCHARHCLPPGSYIDGRSVEDYHEHVGR